jgi:hypothetical protein
MSDPNKFLSSFGQAHLLKSISTLFNHDEQLLQFFFSHKEPVLRIPARCLVNESHGFEHRDQLLVRVALDYWNRRGSTRLSDMLNEWDYHYWLRFLHSVIILEELESEVTDLLSPPRKRERSKK